MYHTAYADTGGPVPVNPVPESLPPLQGTPVPEPKKPDIEYFPIEEQSFDDYIIVDPMGQYQRLCLL
ncbi:hypothetical protein GH771_22380 [Enterobacter cancerogenus]|nr:hypothetical protein GH771_22380 [Enterobacter cancerogenus]